MSPKFTYFHSLSAHSSWLAYVYACLPRLRTLVVGLVNTAARLSAQRCISRLGCTIHDFRHNMHSIDDRSHLHSFLLAEEAHHQSTHINQTARTPALLHVYSTVPYVTNFTSSFLYLLTQRRSHDDCACYSIIWHCDDPHQNARQIAMLHAWPCPLPTEPHANASYVRLIHNLVLLARQRSMWNTFDRSGVGTMFHRSSLQKHRDSYAQGNCTGGSI